MMQAYRISEPSEKSKQLGEEITTVVVNSAVTYKEAEDALEYAQRLLMEQTRPVKASSPLTAG